MVRKWENVQYIEDDTKGLKHTFLLDFPPLFSFLSFTVAFCLLDSVVNITAYEERRLYDQKKNQYITILLKGVLVSYVYDFV